MVFKKNMKNIFTCLIITSLLLLSCTNKELFNEKVKVYDYKPISLNVYDFVLVADESSLSVPDYLGFETSYLTEQLIEWGNKKFKVTGEQNSLSLIIKKFALRKKNIKKYKGLKKIFFSEEKTEYDLRLELSFKFNESNASIKILNLEGNISFFIDDSHSISKKRKILLLSYHELMKKIDNRVKYELKKEPFSSFITTL